MQSDHSTVTGDGDEHQENKESEEEESINQLKFLDEDSKEIPPKKRKRKKIKIDLKRLRLLREKILKRPIFESNADSDPEAAPLAVVFDGGSGSDSDSDIDRDQECASILAVLPKLFGDLAFDLPYEFKKRMNFMGGWSSASPNLVLEKKLRKADVDERRNRLLIPQRKIRRNFLEVEEEEKLNEMRWWMVEMIQPDCSVSLMTLSKWETRKGPAYVMIMEWSEVVERNELKEGMKVQIWSFRGAGGGDGGSHGRLCFALVEVP